MFRLLKKGKYTTSVASVLAMTGLFSSVLMPAMGQIEPSTAIDYRGCAASLLRLGITPEVASQSCAAVLRPRDFSNCVTRIQRQTQVAAADILPSCRLARRPNDLATCVVGISTSKRDSFDPSIFNYCSRSLLPVRFASCVVGIRREIDFSAVQAMETCIDASDRLGGLLPSFVPTNRTPVNTPVPNQSQPNQFNRTFETTPVQPAPVPQRE
ncbi:hypothetical protein NIES4071_95690 [Calothrix sp. NIES-4071]|nr:hypothetical protein NIES4071_95690 [Calothrix sp. NIES-4071]BAZ63834.1 hypothetical protein NIES4105_95620 [Calothrix sp. NIES-4105]